MGENPGGLSPVKLALAELRDMRARLQELEAARSSPIAIVGVAGRFPGAADVDALWELLRAGRVGIGDVPPDRWDAAALFDDDPDAPGRMSTRRGGFLADVDRFDAHFFGVSPREAVSMDPQQRLLLETAWRALEQAAIAPAKLAGTDAGVFVGLSNIDYYRMAFAGRDAIDAYYGSGTSGSVAAGRISYLLGLRGPSLVVDTACSSSLVAAHLACQSLRNDECTIALAGGVNLILTPDINIACSKARMLSPEGLCRTFDARADGYVRSEGCAVVVLKRLEDARRDGDRILAVIRGSAVNQDGRSSGLTVPNGPAQEAVIRRALAAAGVEPHEVRYVEAHGTGTALGDPIEVRALGQVFADRGQAGPLAIGSIKANIGHLEAAAGIAGLVKVVLALQHGTIPGHPHLGERNPHLDWASLPLAIPAAPEPWPAAAQPRIAGVSSFGFSGTNAHLVVEEPPRDEVEAAGVERTRHILTLSARTPESLAEMAADYAGFLQGGPAKNAPIGDVCMSANAGRSHFPHRLAVVGASACELADALASASASDASNVVRGVAEPSQPEVVFLFSGQGAQYAGMARTLYDTQPVFRETLDACDRLLEGGLEPSLLTVLFGNERSSALLSQTAYAQPALFAVEYALAQLWRGWGIEPAAVLGHSVGEYAAACVAGIFSLEDGLRLIAERGRLMQSLPDSGEMAAVFADEGTVRRALADRERTLSIAAINGPDQVVISGDRQAINDLTVQFAAGGIRVRDLGASRAFHSPLLDAILDPFSRAAAAAALSAPAIPLVSNLTGEVASADAIARADYWVRHARLPVQFHRGIETLRRRGHRVFLEIGPAPVLVGMARRFADGADVRWLPSLRRNRDDWDEMLTSLAALYAAGADVDWVAFDCEYPRRKVSVPGYRFQPQRYWLPDGGQVLHSNVLSEARPHPVHPLLGRRIESPLSEVLYDARLGTATLPFLAQHRVFGSLVFPATGYLEMAAAAARTLGEGAAIVEDLVIAEPLTLPDSGERAVQAVLTAKGDRDAAFQIFSRTGDTDAIEWRLHASATLRMEDSPAAETDTLPAARARCAEVVSPTAHYDLFEKSGLEYGPAFRGIVDLWRGDREAVGFIELPADTPADGYAFHPALLDSCFHVLLATLPGGAEAFTGRHFYLPVSVDRLRERRAAGRAAWAHARLRPLERESPETFTGDLVIFDADGAVVAVVEGLTAKRASVDALKGAAHRAHTEWLYQIEWEPKPTAGGPPAVRPGDVWAIQADDQAFATALSARFEAAGARVVGLNDAGPLPLAGIACLWTLGIDGESFASIEAAIAQTADAIVGLARRAAGHAVPRVAIVTRGATGTGAEALAYAPLLSLARAFGAEHPDIRCVSVDLSGTPADVELVWSEISSPDTEDQVAYRGDRRHVARLRRAASAGEAQRERGGSDPIRLTIAERGILDNLRLEPLTRREPGSGEVEIEVAASGLNFRDVLNALGMYPGDPGALGNECVGTVTAVGERVSAVRTGDRVMALVHGGFQSHAVAPAAWVVPVPAGMEFAAAATIPMAFATAEYSLTRLAGLRRGERVLIHAATGGVGLAAVQIARRAGAEIFATAGSDEKRALLASLGIRHVMNSRTVAFAAEILERTNGEGVDVVLNSLTGDAIERSLAVLRPNGRFLEIGKRGIWSAEEMAAVRPDVAYHTIFLGNVDDAVIQSVLRDLAAAFASGDLQPLPRREFRIEDAVDGFRFMAQAKHIGKIVLTQRRAQGPAAGGAVRGDASYLITGGFGGLGLLIARALVTAGARHLVLAGRNAGTDAALAAVSELERAGARVLAATADVSREADVDRLFDEMSSRMPALAGVVHAAGVREDGVLAQMDRRRFDSVMAPKVAGGWRLHRATERLHLDFFVMFSSAAAVLPSPGQGNYAAANAFLDALARHRRDRGLPALSINWGPWDGVGMAAGLDGRDQQRWARHGVHFIAPDEGVRLFERLRGSSAAQVAVVAADWRKFADERGAAIPLIAELAGSGSRRASATAPAARAALVEQLDAAPENRHRDVVLAHVREQVRQVLALEAAFNLEAHQGLRDLGMDSLMALELRNRLQRSVGRSLPATLTFDRPTVAALASYIASDVLGLTAASDAEPAKAGFAPEAVVSGGAEPIAVVGIGCRLPGGVEDSDGFWRLLHDGVDAIREVPRDRWNVDEYYDADPDAAGKMYTRFGGFIDRVDGFDAAFFGISPREAVSLDPQQRLLLEVAWEALEHAGQAPDALLGTRSGVFVGISTYDYALLHMKRPNPAALDTYFGTGTSLSVAAGRLAYSLGLQGPCMAVDTACSSSLVAIHLACRSLRDRECRLALAGGVNLMLTPEPTVNGCRARMLAPDGRCKTFDAAADGYARGEGAGVVVLKRLSDARADGDRVLAVIRGTAVNQDGRSSGLTVPNGPSQQAVIREAIENAGVGPHDLGYVEAHGTGTALGDPIEMEALRRTLAEGRPADQPLVVGSVKTNIGHLEAAAGVAGVIKVILAMRHGEIPAHLHFKTLNPHIALDDAPVAIAAERRPWPAGARRRLAGVSSFGFSGTNAHVVVEEAPVEQEQRRDSERPLHLLALSAKSDEALRELAARHAGQLAARTEPLADVAYTANAGRAHFAHRAALVAASAPDASVALKRLGRGEAQPSIAIGQAAGSAPEIAFLFTGQGSQYPGMGRELFETQPVFRDAMTRCDAILGGLLDVPLVSVLYGTDQATAALLNQTAYTQPALFAIEFALAELWASWGIRPAAVLGHSIGEYVAACVAGVFTVEDGLRLIATRARLMQALRPGSMAAVLAPAAEAADAIRPFGGDLSIAALNGPGHTVISGETPSLEAAVERLAARGIPTQRLVVSHAFHSASMDPMLAEFERVASGVAFSAPKIPLASNLTGRIAGSDIASAAYWREHVRQPVRFADGVERLRDQGCRVFLEIGPRATLLGMARRAAEIDAASCLPSLRPPRGDSAQMLDSLARLFVSGAAVDWAAFDRPYARRKVTVPTYPFQRERYWLDGAGLAAPEAPSIDSSQDPARAQTEPSTYRVDWIAQSVRDEAASGLSGRWIVFADEGGVGHHAATAIDARGGQCTIVSVGDATGRAEDGRWLLNPEPAGDYQRVLAEIVSDRTPVAGVLHLWSLDASSCGASASLVQRAQRLTSASVLLLVQAMLRESVVAPVHVITRGAQPFAIADPAAVSLAQAPLWGLGRTFAVEHPELWGGLIDLDTSDPAEAARQLTGEVARRDDEDQVVLRGGIRYVPRLVATATPALAFAGCRPDASYLVTGGLGTLGLQIARWLAERGARHLVLAGRKGLPDRSTWDSLAAGTEAERQAAAIRAIEGLGATVEVAAADIADERDAGMLFERFGRSAPPLRGIVHAAAAMGGGRLRDMSVDALAAILRPKVTGTCVLDALGERHELDFFVLFSSISSLIGTADLGHYAAANSFLDAFAGYRRAAGRPATSINWGPWQGVRGSADHLDVFARSGMRSMAPAGALAALGRAIADAPANAVVASVDWATFKPVYEARRRRPFLDTIHTSVPRAEARTRQALIEALRQAEPDRRRDVIAAHVRAQAAAVLGLPAGHLDSRKGFFDLGMDSLMSVELRRRLEGSTGLALPATLTFKYATVAALAEFLDGELPGGTPPASDSPAAAAVADEDDLSEDEIAMLLAEKLAQIR